MNRFKRALKANQNKQYSLKEKSSKYLKLYPIKNRFALDSTLESSSFS